MWDFAARHPVPVAVLAVLATIAGGWGATLVGVQVDFVDTVPDDPGVDAYRDMLARLDGVRFVAIYMPREATAPDLRGEGFDPLVQEQGDLSHWLEEEFPDMFSHTLSAWEAMRAGNYMLEKMATAGNPRPESYSMPDDPIRYDLVKQQLLQDESLDDVLARDGSSALVLAFFETKDNLEARRHSGDVAQSLDTWHAQRDPGVTGTPQASGLLVSSDYTDNRNAADLQTWGLVALGAVTAALLWVVRRPSNVVLVMAGVAAATVCTFGIMGLAGLDVNFLTLFLAPIIIGIGVDHGVHLMHRVEEEHSGTRRQAVAKALTSTGPTITLAAITTAAGLATLALVPNPLFAEIAAVAALGIVMALLAALTIVPAVAALLPARPMRPARVGAMLARFAVAVHRRPGVALGVVAVVSVLALAGATQVRIESGSAENEFPQDDPVIMLQHRIEQEYGAFQRGYLVVRGDLTDPAALQALHTFSNLAQSLPLHRESSSVADLLLADEATDDGAADILTSQILGATGQAPSDDQRLPQTRAEAKERLDGLFADPLWRTIVPFTITPDYSLAVVAIQVEPWQGQASLTRLRDAMQELGQQMQAALPEHDVQAAGAPLNRAAIIEQTPVNVAVATLGVALVVGAVMAVAWRRRGIDAVRVAALGTAMVLLAALWLLASVPLLDAAYRVLGTHNSAALTDMFLLAFAITVAVGIDDLVHLAARYWEARDGGADAQTALRNSWTHAGRAVTGTSFTTFVAFAALVGVYFLQSKNLAILTAAGVIYAYTVTFLLAPSVLTFRDRPGHRSTRHSAPRPPTTPRTPTSSPAGDETG